MKRFYLLSIYLLFSAVSIYPCSSTDLNDCRYFVEPESIKLEKGNWDWIDLKTEVIVNLNGNTVLFNFPFYVNNECNTVYLNNMVDKDIKNVNLCNEPQSVKFGPQIVPTIYGKVIKLDWDVFDLDSNPCAYSGVIADSIMKKQDLLIIDKLHFVPVNEKEAKAGVEVQSRSQTLCSSNENFEICYRIYSFR